MQKHILISTSSFDVNSSEPLATLSKNGFKIITNPYGRKLTESEVMELLQNDVIGIIAGVEPLTRNVLSSAKNLKVISRCGIGMDSVDLDAVKDLSMWIKNTPGAPTVAVAELTLAMMLSLLRRIPEADRGIRDSNWKQYMGHLLSAQTVGLIGFGRIGKRVAQLVRSFGARVIVYDKQEISLEADLKFHPMDEVIAKADILSIHVPYAKDTHHLLNKERIFSMKKGARIINTARGGLIDEVALFEALHSGHLAGAALDCFEEEPYTGQLINLPQIVLTAHMGSYAKEARSLMEQEAVDNLVSGLKETGVLV